MTFNINQPPFPLFLLLPLHPSPLIIAFPYIYFVGIFVPLLLKLYLPSRSLSSLSKTASSFRNFIHWFFEYYLIYFCFIFSKHWLRLPYQIDILIHRWLLEYVMAFWHFRVDVTTSNLSRTLANFIHDLENILIIRSEIFSESNISISPLAEFPKPLNQTFLPTTTKSHHVSCGERNQEILWREQNYFLERQCLLHRHSW